MFVVNLDLSGLAGLKNFEAEVKAAAQDAARDLSAMAHAKMIELASERLHSRRQVFVDNLSVREEEGVFVIALAGEVRALVEDGMSPFDMLEGLLSSPKAKTAKDGSKFIVVPFLHGPGKGASNTPASSLDLVGVVKAEMKKRGIPFAKIEKDDQGRPKLGKIRSFDIDHLPIKTHQGPGQGWGNIGDVRQGPNARQKVGGGPAGGGTPFLRGVSVYQHAIAGGGVKKSIVSFRVASSKQEGQWKHPGLPPTRIFEDTEKWALEQIDAHIIPSILERLNAQL